MGDADTTNSSPCRLEGLCILSNDIVGCCLSNLVGLSSSSLRFMGDADTIILSPCLLEGLDILSYENIGCCLSNLVGERMP